MTAITASPTTVITQMRDLAHRRFGGRAIKRRPSLKPRVAIKGVRVELSISMQRDTGAAPDHWIADGTVTLAILVPDGVTGRFHTWELRLRDSGITWGRRITQMGHWDPDGEHAMAEQRRVEALVGQLLTLVDSHGLSGLFQLSRAELCVLCGKPLTDASSVARAIGPECFRRYGWINGLPDLPDNAGDGIRTAALELTAHA
jgi:hypothetical protein